MKKYIIFLSFLNCFNSWSIPGADKFCISQRPGIVNEIGWSSSNSTPMNMFPYGHPLGGTSPGVNVYSTGQPNLYCLNYFNGAPLNNWNTSGPYITLGFTTPGPAEPRWPTLNTWNSVGSNYSATAISAMKYIVKKPLLPWSGPILSPPESETNLLDFHGCTFKGTHPDWSARAIDHSTLTDDEKLENTQELINLLLMGQFASPPQSFDDLDSLFATVLSSVSGADSNSLHYYNTNIPICDQAPSKNCYGDIGGNSFHGWRSIRDESWCCKSLGSTAIWLEDNYTAGTNTTTDGIINNAYTGYAYYNEFLNDSLSSAVDVNGDGDDTDLFDLPAGQKCVVATLPPAGNQAPLIGTSSLSFSGTVGSTLNFNLVAATDAENNSLTYSVPSGITTGITCVSGTTINTLSCSFLSATPTTRSFTYKANDAVNNNSSNIVNVNINITANNDPSCISAAPIIINADAGQVTPVTGLWNYIISPNSSPISYSFVGTPSVFNQSCVSGAPTSTCNITIPNGTPDGTQYNFQLRGQTGSAPIATCNLTINVDAPPSPNLPPTYAPAGIPTGNSGETISFSGTWTDHENDSLSIVSGSNSDGLTCTLATNGAFDCTYLIPANVPTIPTQMDILNIGIKVTDGTTPVTATFPIIVTRPDAVFPVISQEVAFNLNNNGCSLTAGGTTISSSNFKRRCYEMRQRLERNTNNGL
jgi:hypothetical protein